MPDSELRFLVSHLFGDVEGRAAAQRIDRMVGRLPGLGGLHLAEAAVDSMTSRSAHATPALARIEPPAQGQQEKEQQHAC
jgi:hypothetical protein